MPTGFELPSDAAAVLSSLEAVARAGEGRRTRDARTARFGGKAARLAELMAQGLPVPQGWVIDAATFRAVVDDTLPKGHDVNSLIKLAGTREGIERSARARARILADALPRELDLGLASLAQFAGSRAPWGLSVRSSATCEDARSSSLAGLATSILGIRDHAGLVAAVRQVWASLYLPRTLLYLHRWNLRSVAMPVLIMPVVVAEAAGVLFTGPPPGVSDPRWERNERMVHATLGLGAPVVDGASEADSYRLSPAGAVLEQTVAHKTRQLVVGASGLEEIPVDADRADRPALSSEALSQLDGLARLVARGDAEPQDVEFAVDRDAAGRERVVLLQARPLTGGLFPEGGDEDTVWSRANVGEALPGAATPLTWSVAKRFSEAGFRAAFGALGCKVPKGTTLVTNVYGRFYLNLSGFMDVVGQVPGLSPRMLLELSGGAHEADIARLEERAREANWRSFLALAPFRLPQVITRHLRLEREIEAWEKGAEARRRRLYDLDLALLPDDALGTSLDGAAALLASAGELMLTAASASLAANVSLTLLLARLERRVDAHGRDDVAGESLREAARLARSLTGGMDRLESAGPGRALLDVAAVARKDPDAALAILGGGARTLDAIPHGPTRVALERFLVEFGDRGVREAELSTPRWREDPGGLLAMLASALNAPETDPEAAAARARALADRELGRLEPRLRPFELTAVRLLVGRTQLFTRLRERMRAWVTRALGMIRWVALEIDARLRRIDPTLEPGSVFFCTYEELVASLRAGRAELSHVIRLRRAEHTRDRARPDPPATFVGRPVLVAPPPPSGRRLIGLPASPGVVEGPARVLPPGAAGLDAVAAGEILVTRTTDIGLSPLFLIAAGVVTELGGPLSHAAIVAREFNVPAVVNVAGATRAIQTGERLRVDGDRGVVERLDAPEPSPSLVHGPRPK